MQNILRISKNWHDPVSGLNRLLVLILSVFVIEASGFLLKDRMPGISPIFLLGLLRITDILVLTIFGPWPYPWTCFSKGIRDSLIMTIVVSGAGFIFLVLWRAVLGEPMIRPAPALDAGGGGVSLTFLFTACFISPVAEELLFRGIIYRKMREGLKVWTSIGSVSMLFSLIHWHFSGQTLLPFLGSIIFCLCYEKTKFLLTPVLLHISGNLLIYLSPFVSFL